MTKKQQFLNWLQSSTDGNVLGLFRIIYGCLMAWNIINYFRIDLVKNAFILPKIRLHYDYLAFLEPLPEPVMNLLLGVMLVCTVLIAAGLLFRVACFVFGLLFLYIFLIDISIFNNHIYLFILLAFLLATTHADRFLSLRNLVGKKGKELFLIPRWEVFILQLQFAIVYFYGGLAKLYPDWLIRMEPMQWMIKNFPADHIMAPLLKHDFMVPFLTYSGLVFDLAIPFLLWYKPTRKWALIPVLFFHSSNSQIFSDIGIFPYAMILSTIVFFETKEIPFLRNLAPPGNPKPVKNARLQLTAPWVKKVLAGYFIFQLLFPFRGFFLPNPIDWTMVANRFSWRMKIQSRFIDELKFTIQDGPDGPKIPVEINEFINTIQINAAAHDPRGAVAAAKGLAEEAKKQGMTDPIVHASIKVSWNGYPSAYTVNPEIDLTKITYSPFQKMEWIMPKPVQE